MSSVERDAHPLLPPPPTADVRPSSILDEIKRLVSAPNPWLTSEEAAEFLRMNHSEFKALAARGDIPRHELRPNRYRYHAPELTEWLLRR